MGRDALIASCHASHSPHEIGGIFSLLRTMPREDKRCLRTPSGGRVGARTRTQVCLASNSSLQIVITMGAWVPQPYRGFSDA